MRHCIRNGISGCGLTCAPLARPCQWHQQRSRRLIQISSIPSGSLDALSLYPSNSSIAATPDARFEVVGAPYSLLSVSLSASQDLYTRRGTLVGVGGKADNARSTLSILNPLRRAALRIPFLYQKISSTSPVTALISSNSSLAVIKMDGSTDWKVLGKALLAWTGQTISIKPINNWGKRREHANASEVTGRGLLAFAGQGSIFQIALGAEENYVVHPNNLIAYTIGTKPPSPYRLNHASFRFQVPDLGVTSLFRSFKFYRVMEETETWKFLSRLFFNLRSWSRNTLWGDRLFLEFYGPATILLQSQASRLPDVLSDEDVREIAETPPRTAKAVEKLLSGGEKPPESTRPGSLTSASAPPGRMNVASVGEDGKVKFESSAGGKAEAKT